MKQARKMERIKTQQRQSKSFCGTHERLMKMLFPGTLYRYDPSPVYGVHETLSREVLAIPKSQGECGKKTCTPIFCSLWGHWAVLAGGSLLTPLNDCILVGRTVKWNRKNHQKHRFRVWLKHLHMGHVLDSLFFPCCCGAKVT